MTIAAYTLVYLGVSLLAAVVLGTCIAWLGGDR